MAYDKKSGKPPGCPAAAPDFARATGMPKDRQVGGTGAKLLANLPSNGTPGSNLAVANTTLGELCALKSGMTTLGTIGSTILASSLVGSGFMPYFLLN